MFRTFLVQVPVWQELITSLTPASHDKTVEKKESNVN